MTMTRYQRSSINSGMTDTYIFLTTYVKMRSFSNANQRSVAAKQALIFLNEQDRFRDKAGHH